MFSVLFDEFGRFLSAAQMLLNGGIIIDQIKNPLTRERLGRETVKISIATDHGYGKSTRHIIGRGNGRGIVHGKKWYIGWNNTPIAGESSETDNPISRQTLISTTQF